MKFPPLFGATNLILLCLGFALVAGCSTPNGGQRTPSAPDPQATPAPRSEEHPAAFHVEANRYPSLGAAFRAIGETHQGGAALVGGSEDLPGPRKSVGASSFNEGVKRLAALYRFKVEPSQHYVFVYPAGYEALTGLKIVGTLPPEFESTRASYGIGAGTDLFNAFPLLADSLKLTIIADHEVSEEWCGEVFLTEAPVSAIVEALLRSARFLPDRVALRSTEDYVFIHTTTHPKREEPCLNNATLSPEDRAALDRRVSFRFPDYAGPFAFQIKRYSIGDLLPQLSALIGLKVVADPEVMLLPLNHGSYHDLSVRDVLNLLIWQWPLPRYGYEVKDGTIHLRVAEN